MEAMHTISPVQSGRWQKGSDPATTQGTVTVHDLAQLAKSVFLAVETGDSEKIIENTTKLQTNGELVRESITNPLIVAGHLNDALGKREFQWLDFDSKVAIARVFGLYLSITVVINHEKNRQVYDTTKTEFFKTIDRLATLSENKSEVRLRFELEFAREAIKMLSDTSNRALKMIPVLGKLFWGGEIDTSLSFIWEQVKQISRMWLVDVLLIRRCVSVGRTNINDLSVLQDIIRGTYRKNWYCCYAAVESLGNIVRNGATPTIRQQAFFGTQYLPGFRLFNTWGDLKIKTIFIESLLKMSDVSDQALRHESITIQMQYQQHQDPNVRAIFETEKEKQEILSKRREILASRRELLVKKESLSSLSRTVKKETLVGQRRHLDQRTQELEGREKALASQEALLKEKQVQLDKAIDFQEEQFKKRMEETKMHPTLVSALGIRHPKAVPQEPIPTATKMNFVEQIYQAARKKHYYVEGEKKLERARELIIENRHYFVRKGTQANTLVVEYVEDNVIKKVQIFIDERERLLTARKLSARTLDEAMVVIPSGFSPIHWIDLLLYKENLFLLKSKETPAMHIVYTLTHKPPGSFCVSDSPDGNCLSLYFKKGEKILVKLIEIKGKQFHVEDPDFSQTAFPNIKALLHMYHLNSLVRKHDIQTPPPSFTSDDYYIHIEVDDHYNTLLLEKTYSTMMADNTQTMGKPEVKHGSLRNPYSFASSARRTGPPQLQMMPPRQQAPRQQVWQDARVRRPQSHIVEALAIGRGNNKDKRHSWNPGNESGKDHNYLLTPNEGNPSDAQHYLLTPNTK